jgi:hypothetical protein
MEAQRAETPRLRSRQPGPKGTRLDILIAISRVGSAIRLCGYAWRAATFQPLITVMERAFGVGHTMSSSSERAGEARAAEATARPLKSFGLVLWAIIRWFFKLCVLFGMAFAVVVVRRIFFVPIDQDTDQQKGEELFGLFATMVVVMIIWDVAARLGRRSSVVSEFMQGYREARGSRDPKPDNRSRDDARASESSSFRDDARSSESSNFRDKEDGLRREIGDLKAALARATDENASLKATLEHAAEENASLRAQLAMGNDKQGMDQRARAQIRELESILAFPGVRKALVKVLHPDTGEGGSNDTRKEMFQTLMAVMNRMGIRG